MDGVMKENPDELLEEWFKWWMTSAVTPPKLPRALHVRTGLYLGINKTADILSDCQGHKERS